MFRPTYLVSVLALTGIISNWSGLAFGAAAGKAGVTRHGGKALEQMSTKAATNTNAQWAADPDRGWVRADERHKLKEKPGSSRAGKNNDQQKGKGSGKKS
jgi:hypothetical protein